MGVGGWVGAHTGKSVGTHQPPKCEWRGVEPWLCVWQKECAHPHHHHQQQQQEEDKGGQGQKGQGLVGQKEGGRGTNTTTHHKQARKHNGGVTNNNTHTKPQQEEEEERTEREVEARGRKGGAASTRHSECVGGVWHTRGTNHTPHPLNTQRERDRKRKGTREKTEEDKGQGVVYGCGGDGKAGGKQVGDTPPLCPTFLPNPFFLPFPLFTPSLFPPFKTPNIMDYPFYFYKTQTLFSKPN